MENYINEFADFLRLHLASISVGLISALLTIYGNAINEYAKKLTRKLPFLARFIFFIVLCSAGYGFISSQTVRFLRHFLMKLPDMHLIVAVAASFILLGFLARSSKSA